MESLMVVWENDWPNPAWFLAEVANCRAARDPSAPKKVSHSELQESLFGDYVLVASSKEEALLKYAATGQGRPVWSIEGGERVSPGCGWQASPTLRGYRLVREEPF